MSSKLMKTRNLLAENDLYQLFELTFLRQQVVNVREVTTLSLENIAFGRNDRMIPARTCSRESSQRCFLARFPKISLNAKSRVQVCARSCTGEFAP